MTITWDGDDPWRRPLTSTIEWSTDGGTMWQIATAALGSPSANPDVLRATPFVGVSLSWDTFADGVATTSPQQVALRATVAEVGTRTTGSFVPHPTTPSIGGGFYRTSSTRVVALGDFDGDLDLDVVVGNDWGQVETVWLNDGAGSFSPHPTTPDFFGGGGTTSIAVGDLDGDGDLDLVVGNEPLWDYTTTWLNDGSGGFSAHPTTPRFSYGNTNSIALGDLDGDGDLDLVVSMIEGGLAEVWLNDGTGSFRRHPTSFNFAGGARSTSVALGDLDADGDLDAVLGNEDLFDETVWLNDGTGSFTAHPTTPSFMGSYFTTSVVLGDLDGDLDLDMVVGSDYSWPDTVWLNDGAGNFSAHPTMPSFGGEPTLALALGDLDGDLDLDLVVGSSDWAPETVWLNDGTGSFTAHPTTPSFVGGDTSNSVALGDLDGDSDLDLVVGNHWLEAETVWLNDGTGSFGPHGTTPSFGRHFDNRTSCVALEDLDGDFDLDLVVGDSLGNAVTIWLNDGTGSFATHPTIPSFGGENIEAIALGDLDGDRDFDIIVCGGLFGWTWPEWLNDGVGNFSRHPTLPWFGSSYTSCIALGDLDGDRDLDVVLGSADGRAETVWLNDDLTGKFSAHPMTPSFGGGSGDDTHAIALGDLDGDLDLDLVAGNGGYKTVWLNDGAGNFSAHPTAPASFWGRTVSLALGDLDGDFDLDLVAGNVSEPDTLWLNDGTGNLTAYPTPAGLGTGYTYAVALGDLDGDFDLDVLIGRAGGTETVWLNDGAAGFSPHPTTPFFGGDDTSSLALGDIDGDGDLDVVVGNGRGQALTVWVNENAPPASGSCALSPITIDNRPTCAITSPSPLTRASPDLLITFEADDLSGGPITSTFEYSLDDSATWLLATASPASALANPDLARPVPITGSTFTWDTVSDLLAGMQPRIVPVRITVANGIASNACEVQIDHGCLRCGDCNVNGLGPDILDALDAGRIAVGLFAPTPVQAICCDVDSNGVVNLIDALRTAQAAVALPVALACP